MFLPDRRTQEQVHLQHRVVQVKVIRLQLGLLAKVPGTKELPDAVLQEVRHPHIIVEVTVLLHLEEIQVVQVIVVDLEGEDSD